MTRRMDLDKEVSDIDPAGVAIHCIFARPDYSFFQVPYLGTLRSPASRAAPGIFDN
jgi:hypothetical protein